MVTTVVQVASSAGTHAHTTEARAIYTSAATWEGSAVRAPASAEPFLERVRRSGARSLRVHFSLAATGAVLLLLVGSAASIDDRTISRRAPGSPTLGTTANCNAAETRELVQRFINSFDRGDIRQLDQLVAGTNLFQWYSTDAPGQRIDPEARDRNSLIAYFEKRHEKHERLVLQSFSFNGISSGFGHFQFELSRSADDGLPPTAYVGKGAVDCSSPRPTLAVWSMARQPRPLGGIPLGPLMGAVLVIVLVGGGIAWHQRRRAVFKR